MWEKTAVAIIQFQLPYSSSSNNKPQTIMTSPSINTVIVVFVCTTSDQKLEV